MQLRFWDSTALPDSFRIVANAVCWRATHFFCCPDIWTNLPLVAHKAARTGSYGGHSLTHGEALSVKRAWFGTSVPCNTKWVETFLIDGSLSAGFNGPG